MPDILVGTVNELAHENDYKVVAVGEREVGIFRLGDGFVAYENHCPHDGGPVCQGKRINRVVEIIDAEQRSCGLHFGKQSHIVCPWHGYEFDIATGCHPGDPAVRLKRLELTVQGNEIFVRL